jgi:hypothetical protein
MAAMKVKAGTSSAAPIASLVPPASRPTLKLKLKAPVAAVAPVPSVAPKSPALEASPKVPTPPTPPKRLSRGELRALLAQLREAWPAAFPDPPRPLAIGTGKLAREARPASMSNRDLNRAMGFYCSSDAYLEALGREGARRIAFDGSDAGAVEAEHRLMALARLEERAAKRRAASQEQTQRRSADD